MHPQWIRCHLKSSIKKKKKKKEIKKEGRKILKQGEEKGRK